MKELIVRADDLGYSEGVTYGILSAYHKGIVRSTAVMVNMPFAREGIEMALKCPDLALGLHCNMTNERPCLKPEEVPGMVGEDGKFVKSSIRRQQLKDGIEPFEYDELYREFCAQCELFIEIAGKKPDYIDCHVFELDVIQKALLAVQEKYDIKECIYANKPAPDKMAQAMAQYDFYQHQTDNFVELFSKGYFKLDEGINVLVTHPGYIDPYIVATSRMIDERLYDYQLVTDPQVIKWLEDNNIRISSFKDHLA